MLGIVRNLLLLGQQNSLVRRNSEHALSPVIWCQLWVENSKDWKDTETGVGMDSEEVALKDG